MKFKINTSNITVGQRIKNFKELCSALHIPEKYQTCGGKQRQSLLKDIQRYMKYERSGQAYIIQEIYEMPIPKIDNRVRGIYLDNIEPLLYCILYEDSQHNGHRNAKKKKCVKTMLQWYQAVGLCNLKYKDSTSSNKFFKDMNIEYFYRNHFYFTIDGKMKQILYSSLNSLKKRKIIDYNEKLELYFTDYTHEIASQKSEAIIRSMEQDLVKEKGVANMYQLKIVGKTRGFYNKIVERLREKAKTDNNYFEFYNLSFYYKVIEISYSPAIITEHFKQLQMKNFNKEQTLLNNNKNFVISLKEYFRTKSSLPLSEEQHNSIIDELISIQKEGYKKVDLISFGCSKGCQKNIFNE